MKKVSVIVPIYNVEEYIGQCIDSLLSQTYQNLEIILVDDGSTDKSGEICDRFQQSDSRVHTIHKKNGGLSSARQAGVEVIHGDYVLFVDGDDWIETNTIELCINEVMHKRDIGCVLFSYMREYPSKSLVAHVFDGNQEFDGDEAEDLVYRRLFGLCGSELAYPERMHNLESCCMKFYSTKYVKQARFFDTQIVGSSEDALFNMYALYGCISYTYLDLPLYHYRKNEQSLSNTYKKDLPVQWQRLFKEMNEVIISKNLGPKYKEALQNRIALSILGIGLNEISYSKYKVIEHTNHLRKYLTSKEYCIAIQSFDISQLPHLWKILMLSCKYKLSLLVYCGLIAIEYLRKRR